MTDRLALRALPDIPLIQADDSIPAVVTAGLRRAGIALENGDVVAIAQKIVSKAEGRLVPLSTVTPSARATQLAAATDKDPRLVELILRESRRVVRQRPGLILVEHNLGFVCANAGIDRSNVMGDEDHVLLLPEDPDSSARQVQEHLASESGLEIGVLIVDSHGRPWRLGTVGVAIGTAGVPGVQDLRGVKDLSGRPLQSTEIGVADQLASAASILMGQAAESQPVVHMRGAGVMFRQSHMQEMLRPAADDLFR